MKRITIDPITRLEGHGKIEIFLNDSGNVENAYLQIPELRGFEKFSEGRLAEDMPQITSRICGVCPVSHHFASTKAIDAAFNTKPTETAKKLRELMYCGYITYDHILHFYFLGGPDFVMGPDASKKDRNIIGVIGKVGVEIGKEVIKHRAFGQKITRILGGKPTHPVCGLPGGVSKGLNEEERKEIEGMAESCVKFAQFSLNFFKDTVLKNKAYLDLIKSEAYTLETYNMGLVDRNNNLNFYEGKIRVKSPLDEEFACFEGDKYIEHIGEHVEPWTYMKYPYLKEIGWKGLTGGVDSGIYRVGPLGRINVIDGFTTPLANEAYKELIETLGKPVNSTLAYHWARLIELLYASERALELSRDKDVLKQDLRNKVGKPTEGIGVVEAARGTLIHHYKLTEDARIEKANMIVATTNNAGAICMSVKNAAMGMIKNGKVDDGILNKVEMAFRAYDPCFACSTHCLPGTSPIEISIYDKNKDLVKKIGGVPNDFTAF
ncbi:MAG: Ni/Fe hydrogenase subunit alpha [Candidatus Methanofastidiosum sp.]|nr:Ni/Fe hydrogenase subunit alpha [Methanofastidiosum sp.]HOT84850.1 Ni/Fe hydrogenase subunit alpha [Methanofastidiosum sp.]HQF90273.1 Ni/Fe hydrogenase subunit alpha [Methanofastidiosum sp.]HQG61708.1 Ni/Fe hydrogenase subunit alpha [Methanofastidiosum sp.]